MLSPTHQNVGKGFILSYISKGILKKTDFEKLHLTGVKENSIAVRWVLRSSRKNFKRHQNYKKKLFFCKSKLREIVGNVFL